MIGKCGYEGCKGCGQPPLYDPEKEIAIIWHIDDVKYLRPDLTNSQAFEVLQAVKKNHDCNYGVTWLSLGYQAEYLYPKGVKK